MIETNPYAPPKAETSPASAEPIAAGMPPSYKLYSAGQVFLAGFLGTPVAGFYLLSENRRRMGHTTLARTTLVGGGVVTVALLVIAFAVPSDAGRTLPIAASIALWQYAKQDEPLLDAHQGKGGKVEPTWKAAGIGLASLVGYLVLMVVITMLIGDG